LRRAAKKHSALFSLRHNTEFKSHRIDQNEQAVYAQLNAASRGEYTAGPFSIVIACGGAGIERTRVPDEHPTYTGYQFWKVDPYDKSNLGLPADVKPTVLISGGGDGSLQDYLRVVCRKTAGDIYSELPDVLKPYMEQQIAKIEDIAMRSYLWGDAGELDHPIHQEVQERYHGLIVYLLTKDPAAGALERSLKRLVDHSMDRLSLKFIYPCEHFWSCYPLNRFLVLLLSEYLQRHSAFRHWNATPSYSTSPPSITRATTSRPTATARTTKLPSLMLLARITGTAPGTVGHWPVARSTFSS
jgi:hypothetical protein